MDGSGRETLGVVEKYWLWSQVNPGLNPGSIMNFETVIIFGL